MTLQALATLLVNTMLDSLDDHLFAAIPQADIQQTIHAVAQVLRDESASMAETEETPCAGS